MHTLGGYLGLSLAVGLAARHGVTRRLRNAAQRRHCRAIARLGKPYAIRRLPIGQLHTIIKRPIGHSYLSLWLVVGGLVGAYAIIHIALVTANLINA